MPGSTLDGRRLSPNDHPSLPLCLSNTNIRANAFWGHRVPRVAGSKHSRILIGQPAADNCHVCTFRVQWLPCYFPKTNNPLVSLMSDPTQEASLRPLEVFVQMCWWSRIDGRWSVALQHRDHNSHVEARRRRKARSRLLRWAVELSVCAILFASSATCLEA